MNNLFNLFTNRELIIMGSIIVFLIILILVLVMDDLINKRREKKFQITLVEENAIKSEIDNYDNISRQLDNMDSYEFNEIKDNDIEINNNKENFIEELITDDEPTIVKIEKEDEKGLNNQEKAQVELLKIEDELTNVPSLEDTITNLENLEEENAIISYQELLENTGDLTRILEDDGDEPITIDEVFKLFSEDNNEGLVINESLEALPIEEAYRGEFISTPYLSPINGFENENLAEIQLENTANLEKLDKEIRKTNQFLNILNELKKNLD